MFTGIIETSLEVSERREDGVNLVLSLDLPSDWAESVRVGDSIAISGCCLTVAKLEKTRATFELVSETLALTNLGDISLGEMVNVERAMPANGRFDGHIVQGHVDAVGTISDIVNEGGERRVRLTAPQEFLDECVHKGSVCIDGISLTIAELNDEILGVAIIPHTWELTNLKSRRVGDRVNLEADVVGKYVKRMLTKMLDERGDSGITVDFLREKGFA